MITNQNQAYASLFAKASQALDITNPDEYISSLNEYFSVIEDLAQIDLKYTILPLDEETFDINANTRIITVPPSFKNGVGVKGDQVAEIIYFKIDRYFDATDLNTQNIYIEWENSKGDKGLSKEYVRDVTSDADHIIFGWPLAAQITEYAGPVKFAVRFYSFKDPEAENKEIVYSFSTQPQTIMINNTMDFNITDDSIQRLDDEVIEMIRSRFQNSEKDEAETDVPAPTFLLNLTPGDYDIEAPEETYTLKAQAVGTGNISYILQRAQIGSATWVNQEGSSIKVEYLPTTDTERNSSKIYYTKVEKEGVFAYEVYSDDFDEDSNSGIYERYCFAYVSKPGDYAIQAKNRVGVSSKTQRSEVVTFPNPIAPVLFDGIVPVILDENGKATLNSQLVSEKPIGVLTYIWSDENGVVVQGENNTSYNVETDLEEKFYYLSTSNKRNNESALSNTTTYRVTKPAQVPRIISPSENSQQSYVDGISLEVQIDMTIPHDNNIKIQWFKSVDLDMTNLENDIPCGEQESINAEGKAVYKPTASCMYYAIIELERNTSKNTAITHTWTII